MCRLFGFRSVIASQVHRSLVAADNALGRQSEAHPDGWGVAYFVEGAPHVTKSAATAVHDALFARVSGVVASEAVVAHVRRATTGDVNVLNTHPFQHGRWVFAHNGEIPRFDECRDELEAGIAPRLQRYLLGDTDSERIFGVFLTELARRGPLSRQVPVESVVDALGATVAQVRRIVDGRPGVPAAELTLLVSNGFTLAAVQGGKELHWSTHKARCADRDSCVHLGPECEAPTRTGFVNHLVLASEPLGGENVWQPLAPGAMIGVDERMRLHRATTP